MNKHGRHQQTTFSLRNCLFYDSYLAKVRTWLTVAINLVEVHWLNNNEKNYQRIFASSRDVVCGLCKFHFEVFRCLMSGADFTRGLWAHNSKLVRKYVLLLYEKWWSNEVTILHMPRQLSCRVTCKIVLRLVHQNPDYSEWSFHKIQFWARKILYEVGPWWLYRKYGC